MPLVAWLVAAYLGGSLVGFAAVAPVASIAAIATMLGAAIVGRSRIAMAAVVFIAGVLAANSWKQEQRSCASLAARSGSLRLELIDEASPGSFTRARVDCGARVSLFVAHGRAEAGATVRVKGIATIALDSASVTIRAADIEQVSPAPWTARLRTAALRSTDRDFGTDAPLVRALVLADMREMSPEIRDRWATAGMVHMLSVSGLHVGIIAAVVELLLGAMRVSRRSAPIAAVVIIAVYVAIIGAPPPAVRSAVMLGLRATTRMVQRSVSPWAVLAIGALHPVVAPEVVLDLGYQLSVIGVAALIAAGQLLKRLPLPRRPRWTREIGAGIVCTLVATIASLPLVAWSMGRVSLIAPVSNLVAGPFVAAVQPMLFLGVLLAPVPFAAQFVADAAHPLLVMMDAVASASASVPGASITVWPTATAAVLSAVVAVAALAACMERQSLRAVFVAVTALAVMAWWPAPRGGRLTELHVIDVGQGDAVALRTRRGHWILFDAGRNWEGGDAGRRTVVPYIAHRGGSLEAFVLSHPHSDHVGGAASVIQALHPRIYFDGAFVVANGAYRSSLLAAKQEGTRWRRVHPADSIVVDEVSVVFLAPDSSFAASLPDPNNASAVALITVGDVRMLMMGDAEREEERWLLENAADRLRVDVLKVGHHGSSTSSTPEFLDAVRPRIALVSVGEGNTYGHPSAAIMSNLAERGAEVLRTDRMGTIIVETDGRTVRFRAR
jgi:competence protein ComEC